MSRGLAAKALEIARSLPEIEVVEGDPIEPEEGKIYFVIEREGIPVPNYYFRFDASALDLNDGDRIAIWPDLSGNGNDLTQDVASDQPIFLSTGLNGKPTVQFNNSHLINDSFSLDNVGGATTFIVMQTDDNTVSSSIMTIRDFDEGIDQFEIRFSGNDQDVILTINGSRGAYAPLIADSAVLYTATYNSSMSRIYSNGTHVRDSTSVTGDIGAHNMLALGGRPRPGNTPSIPYYGRISELIYYSRELSALEIDAVNNYLMDKWGL